jgi:hypothetical protein
MSNPLAKISEISDQKRSNFSSSCSRYVTLAWYLCENNIAIRLNLSVTHLAVCRMDPRATATIGPGMISSLSSAGNPHDAH